METTRSKKTAIIALLTALSLIAFIIESLLPPLFVPGAKIGLSNIFIALCLILYSLPEAFIMLAAKCIVAAIFGGFSQILYSAPAGLAAMLVIYVLVGFFSDGVSVVAACALGAVVHNIVQLSIFSAVTEANVFYYAPYLTIAGLVAGVVTGLSAYYSVKYFPIFDRKKEI